VFIRAGKKVYYSTAPPATYDTKAGTATSELSDGGSDVLGMEKSKLVSTITGADGTTCVYNLLVMAGSVMGQEGKEQPDEAGVFQVSG